MTERAVRLAKVGKLKVGKKNMPDRKMIRIAVTNIKPDVDQDRKDIKGADWDSFVSSIKLSNGPIQPIFVVRVNDSDVEYMIEAGERRWLACVEAEIDTIDAIVNDHDDVHHTAQLIENVSKLNLTAIEIANALQRRLDLGMSHDDLSTAIGMSVSRIKQRIALLNYPQEVQALAQDGIVTHPNRLASLRKLADREPLKFAEVDNLLRDGINYAAAVDQATTPTESNASVIYAEPNETEEIPTAKKIEDPNRPLLVPLNVLSYLLTQAGFEAVPETRDDYIAIVKSTETSLLNS
ncbi:ParB/RepB/Spo0J family partition protein [Gammaproteobacteria bacterium]|nr:ParB/RepB/Spo0J family partition protein [Gammaproteobacteria bacterium]